jgi:hypothetical protein
VAISQYGSRNRDQVLLRREPALADALPGSAAVVPVRLLTTRTARLRARPTRLAVSTPAESWSSADRGSLGCGIRSAHGDRIEHRQIPGSDPLRDGCRDKRRRLRLAPPVATGLNFPDALPAAAGGGRRRCSWSPSDLPESVASEISRLGSTQLIILGERWCPPPWRPPSMISWRTRDGAHLESGLLELFVGKGVRASVLSWSCSADPDLY